MNNNRGNNRRRGRGNNRPQGGGGNGQQLNRIDSRARGNAPQLLEKYRKLAHDAHLNGDRVTAEYYLQFADHYFRVIADTRMRQEEQRGRREDRWQEPGEAADDSTEFTVESDFPEFDQPYTRREREERDGERVERPERPERGERQERAPREDRARREDRPRRDDRPYREDAAPVAAGEGQPAPDGGEETRSVYEPVENPFIRGTRGLRPRREDRRPARVAEARASGTEQAPVADEPAAFDASVLPPSISITRDETPATEAAAAEAPAPKRRGRKPKVAAPEATSEA